MYNGAGNWMVDVGIPAKSGVSGGIFGVVPGVCGVAVFSPRLNPTYNSIRGIEAFNELSFRLRLHVLKKKKKPTWMEAIKGKRNFSNSTEAMSMMSSMSPVKTKSSSSTPTHLVEVTEAIPAKTTTVAWT